MAWYSGRPLRAAAQLGADLLLVVWIVVWVRVAGAVRAGIERLATPLDGMDATASRVADELERAGSQARRVPVVGRDLGEQVTRAADAVQDLAGVGATQAASVRELAASVGLLVLVLPVAAAVLVWLPGRLRFVLAAVRARRLARTPVGRSVLAFRALMSESAGRLTAVSTDPVQAVLSRDAVAVEALARLHLRTLGVRPPATVVD